MKGPDRHEGTGVSAYGRTVTPEAVTIALDVAGLGSRMIAWLIDTLIQLAIAVPILLGIGAVDLSGSVELVVLSLILFLLFWGYYPIFELSWQGQTPGKRAQRLRVIRTDGQPAGGACSAKKVRGLRLKVARKRLEARGCTVKVKRVKASPKLRGRVLRVKVSGERAKVFVGR